MITPKYDQKRAPKRSVGRTSKRALDRVRDGVFLRDDYQCLVAGSAWDRGVLHCAGGLTLQHAVARGMGGSALYDGTAYLRTFCVAHNVLDVTSADFHDFCLRMGWAIPRNIVGVDPEKVPVRYPDGHDYLLYHVGFGRSLLTRDEAAELRALQGWP